MRPAIGGFSRSREAWGRNRDCMRRSYCIDYCAGLRPPVNKGVTTLSAGLRDWRRQLGSGCGCPCFPVLLGCQRSPCWTTGPNPGSNIVLHADSCYPRPLLRVGTVTACVSFLRRTRERTDCLRAWSNVGSHSVLPFRLYKSNLRVYTSTLSLVIIACMVVT